MRIRLRMDPKPFHRLFPVAEPRQESLLFELGFPHKTIGKRNTTSVTRHRI